MSELSSNFQDDLIAALRAPSYPITEISRLVGITRYRTRRWLKGYEYKYKGNGGKALFDGSQESLVNRGITKEIVYASFLELIDLLFVKEFVNAGLSLPRIRKALDETRKRTGAIHFASNKFITSGKDIVLEVSGNNPSMIVLLTGGQSAIPNIFERIGNRVDYEKVTGMEYASRWFPEGRDGMIVVDPQISFGRPTIIGRRVTTASVFELFKGENKQFDSVSQWLDIPNAQVQAAVNYEYSLAA